MIRRVVWFGKLGTFNQEVDDWDTEYANIL